MAVVLVAAPLAMALLMLSGHVSGCLGGSAHCGFPPPDTSGPLDEPWEVLAAVIALAVVWFVAAVAGVRHVWRADRARIVHGARVSFALITMTGVIVAVLRFSEARRLRVVAEDAGLYALGVACVIVPLALVWAVVTVRSPVTVAREG